LRLPDWRERLSLVMRRHADEPFTWGRSDCFLLAMDVCEAILGTDPYADERGRYRSAVGAARRLRRRGFGSPEDALAAVSILIEPAAVLPGDIAIVDDVSGGEAMAVVTGRLIEGKGVAGAIRLPLTAAKRAYRF